MLPTILIIAWLALPALVWFALLCLRRRFHAALVCALCVVTMIAGTVVLANYVWALDAHLLAEIDKYNPDSPEAQRASEAWASDTDRSLLLLLSPLLTGVLYTVLFLLLFASQWIFGRIFSATFVSQHAETNRETAGQQADAENPYQPPTVG